MMSVPLSRPVRTCGNDQAIRRSFQKLLKISHGGIRLVNNCISLNKRTVDDRYQTPNANELLYSVAGVSYKIILQKLSSIFTGSKPYTN